jgi:hypothetical protein
MSDREWQRSRALGAYFRPRLPDRLGRLLFDSGKPGRPSVGEAIVDRLDELLIVAGLRLLLVALFVDLVTTEFIAMTAFNVLLGLPVLWVTAFQFFDAGHALGETSRWDRLTQWRRDRRWYSKQRSVADDDGWH